MASIVIDLQDGFDGELVTLSVDEAEVFKGTDVRTRYQIGLAHRVELDLAPGPHVLRVALPARNLTATADIDPAQDGHVGISRLEGRLEIRSSSEPFRYA